MPFAKSFLSSEEQKQVVQAIAEAELFTSGEIRLHLESFCIGDPVKAARRVFKALHMHQTAERNGVLIYMATWSHKVAVIGDEGIHARLGQVYWDELVQNMIKRLQSKQKAEALKECIVACGRQLGHYFPRKDNDKNELSDSISFK